MSITKRNGKFYSRFQLNGERHHYLCSGATTVKEAEKIENAFIYKLQQQQNGVIPHEKEKISLSYLFKYYLEYAQTKKSYKADKSRMVLIQEYFKKKKYITDIKPEDIEKFKQFLLKRDITKTTVNRYLEVLSKMFNMAIDNDWITKNPIKKNTKFPVKNYQVRYLKEDEEKRIFEACPDYFKPILIVALNTGLRKGNIQTLKWSNILLDFRLLELTDNKGNKHIKMYINDTLYELFSNLPKVDEEYVFINPRSHRIYSNECFRDTWNAIREKAGVGDFRFHDFRHTVGTRMAERGVPVPVIKDVLAHSDIRTTMRYVHSVPNQLKSAMEVL